MQLNKNIKVFTQTLLNMLYFVVHDVTMLHVSRES